MTKGYTDNQELILAYLKRTKRWLSAQELFTELREHRETIGLATIYRALDILKRSGEVNVRALANGEFVYSSLAKDEHFLTCLECGVSVPVPDCPVHKLETKLAKNHDFTIFYHTLEFFGLCNNCSVKHNY